MRRIALLAALAAVLLPASARADHRETVLASPGSAASFYAGGSADGEHVYFVTDEQLAAEDTDGGLDLYDRHDGRSDLVSVPADGGSAGNASSAVFDAASPDGSRVYFTSRESLSPDDQDGLDDVYLREGGHTTLVSRSNGQFNFLGFYFWCGATDDGGHVWFRTPKQLDADDTDFSFDLYEYDVATDSLEMVSRRASGSNGGGDVGCAGRRFFSTSTAMTPDDSDGATDIYRRTSSGTELMTPDTAEDVQSMSTSEDGEHVIFESTEQLASADTDDQKDVYERTGGQYVLVSQGPESFNGDFRSDFQRASADGTRIFWTTSDHPVASDTDDADDIFVRAGGTTRIVSHGPAGGDAGYPIVVERANRAGTRLYFRTGEDLTSDDHDFSVDSYVWDDGTVSRASVAGAHDDDVGYDAGLAGATEDGSRVFFTSLQSLDEADTDTIPAVAPDGYDDIFERAFGESHFLSTGPNPDPGPPVDAFFRGYSDDGEEVWFDTTERLTGDDTDDGNDVYESRINRSPVVQAGASRAVLRYRDGSAPLAIDPALTVDDPDTPALTGATVRVSGGFHAGDAIRFTPASGIGGSQAGDTLTLTGAASPAEYQDVLRSLTFATNGSGGVGGRTFEVSVTDSVDTSAAASRSLEVVRGLQVPSFTEAPAALSSDRSPRFVFAGADGAQLECSSDGAAFAPCGSPFVAGPLADGPHAFEVRERDGADVSAAAHHDWTVDTAPPAAPLLLGPDARTTERSVELAFTGEPDASFECARDGAAFEACASPVLLRGLGTGRHTVAVRQTDAAGNTGPAATAAWEVVAASAPPSEGGAPLHLSAALGSPLVVGADGFPVGCRLAGAFLRRCDVVVTAGGSDPARPAGATVLGRGSARVHRGRHRAVVHALLNRSGIRHVRRRGRRGERVRVRVTARSVDGRSATTTAGARVMLPGRYVVPADGGYGVNVATLSPGRKALLVTVARQLTGTGVARCEGHADGTATRAHARRLARRRAAVVCRFLRAHGVDALLVVHSYGHSRPRATNATRRGRWLNRRVEISVVR